jgi:hypothetical protein
MAGEVGIPVWHGAVVRWTNPAESAPETVTGFCDFVRGDVVHIGGRHFSPSACAPYLSDPDTCAAYVRRLALALGAPAEAVEEGVRFFRVHETCWEIRAGADWGLTFTEDDFDDPFPTTRLLALARAWPADKRVGR